LRRELCSRKSARIASGYFGRFLLLALFGATAALSPTRASAQAPRKDANPNPAVTIRAADQKTFGKDLFRQHCASCHFAETSAQKIGPGLKGLYPRLTFSDGKKVSDAALGKWIESGGKNMPGFQETMRPDEIRALISYIKTL
jgi:mono/diheme cytochrome c family protein